METPRLLNPIVWAACTVVVAITLAILITNIREEMKEDAVSVLRWDLPTDDVISYWEVLAVHNPNVEPVERDWTRKAVSVTQPRITCAQLDFCGWTRWVYVRAVDEAGNVSPAVKTEWDTR